MNISDTEIRAVINILDLRVALAKQREACLLLELSI